MKCNNILLLCHGKNHKQYSKYYKRAITIDYNPETNPHIVHDLRDGLPTKFCRNKKFHLIQSVYWAQLHRSGYRFNKYGDMISKKTPFIKKLRNRMIVQDKTCLYNYKLLQSISNNLHNNGFFVCNQTGCPSKYLNMLLNSLNLYETTYKHVEKQCGFKIKPKYNLHNLVCYQKLCNYKDCNKCTCSENYTYTE